MTHLHLKNFITYSDFISVKVFAFFTKQLFST